MPWEIASRADPDARGERFDQLATAARTTRRGQYVRWIPEDDDTQGDRQDG